MTQEAKMAPLPQSMPHGVALEEEKGGRRRREGREKRERGREGGREGGGGSDVRWRRV